MHPEGEVKHLRWEGPAISFQYGGVDAHLETAIGFIRLVTIKSHKKKLQSKSLIPNPPTTTLHPPLWALLFVQRVICFRPAIQFNSKASQSA